MPSKSQNTKNNTGKNNTEKNKSRSNFIGKSYETFTKDRQTEKKNNILPYSI